MFPLLLSFRARIHIASAAVTSSMVSVSISFFCPSYLPTLFLLKRLLAEPVEGVSATPYEDNLRYFNVAIAGPMDSPFEGGLFRLELFLPAEYPMKAPKVYEV